MADDPARELFDQLAGEFLGRPAVVYGRIWHNDGLTVGGKTFAMVVRGQLVVKVPAAQAAELCASGAGVAFEPRAGRPTREWVCVDLTGDAAGVRRWRQLMEDAYSYGVELTGVAAAGPPAGRAARSRSERNRTRPQ
jgi:hypothetical protein